MICNIEYLSEKLTCYCFKGTQNGSSRNVSAVLTQRNERILNKEFKFTLLSKKCESKPSTSTTGNIIKTI